MELTTLDPALDPALAAARQSLHRFMALSFLDPRADSWFMLDALREEPLLVEAAAIVRGRHEAEPTAPARGEWPPGFLDPAAVLSRLPVSADALNRRYEEAFGLLVTNACPPYETEYIPEKLTFQRSNTLADLAGFYHAFGLAVSSRRPERPDHIVLELEFMSLLIGLERRAEADPPPLSEERRSICRDTQRVFLRDHLVWWVPAFVRLLSREDPDGFYAAAGRFLSALMLAERAHFGIEAPEAPEAPAMIPTSGTLERSEACEGCGVV
jgi:TorA maturation chaperone TorD